MLISYNWLKTYLDIDLTADEVAEILTNTGLEVEGVEKNLIKDKLYNIHISYPYGADTLDAEIKVVPA